MSSTPNLEDPKQVVLAFAAAYNQWEDDATHKLDDPVIAERHKQMLLDYCTHKSRPLVDGRMSCGSPAAYENVTAANVGETEYVSTTRAHVDTLGLKSGNFRFILLKKPDGWRIDVVQSRWTDDEKWKNNLIGSMA